MVAFCRFDLFRVQCAPATLQGVFYAPALEFPPPDAGSKPGILSDELQDACPPK